MDDLPLTEHDHDQPSAFSPEALISAVRSLRALPSVRVPDVVVLEFDGDLYDALARCGRAQPWPTWACFHTPMMSVLVDGEPCGIVPRTIGGPFATLVAEQLFASGARVVLGLTSAGRVRADHRLPHFVVVDEAIRDEGTSLHYLPPSRTVRGHRALNDALAREIGALALPCHRGLAWSTDAPYRETASLLRRRAAEGALAVEMQAASLFAFAEAKKVDVGVVAYVTNAVDDKEAAPGADKEAAPGADKEAAPFDKGPEGLEEELLLAMCRAAQRYLQASPRGER